MKKVLITMLLACASAPADVMTIDTYNFQVPGGGGFQAAINNGAQFQVFCGDYLNYVNVPDSFPVNVSTLSTGIADTRYGTSPQAFFLFQTVPAGQPDAGRSLGTAYNRYLLAAHLTTQYDLLHPNTSMDIGIQHAIWDLLNVEGGSSQTGDTNLWLNNAVAWEDGQTLPQLVAFADTVKIYTSTDVASIDWDNFGTGPGLYDRYRTGKQEQIGVVPPSAVPEPASIIVFGTLLIILLPVLRRKMARSL
jgi:hypothetical protein